MSTEIAHKWEEKTRTTDVVIDQNISFAKMMLTDQVLLGLNKCGFIKPSPIQLRAIPLGRSGLDLLIQAKSGTGKTLVFATIILEAYRSEIQAPQSLVIVPTREIAVQIESILKTIGYAINGFKVRSFIGGLDVTDDRKKIQNCRAVVGTPGRILHLINNSVLNTKQIKILVLDEADKLMSPTFQSDINQIYECLTSKLQVIAASATYENNLEKILLSYMKNPIGVTPKREAPILLGVKQFYYEITDDHNTNSVKEMIAKVEVMQKIFSTLPFKQCLVFSNSQSRSESYCNYLIQNGWPTSAISGLQVQKVRLAVFKKFKEFKCRILTATDLMARGIDSENVNLVINVEVPNDSSIYLHRIGRCGRFGSHGIAITLINSDKEMIKFRKLLGYIGGSKMSALKFPTENISDIWNFADRDKDAKVYGEIYGICNDNSNVVNLNIENVKKTEQGLPMKCTDDNFKNENNLNIDIGSGEEKLDIINKNMVLLEISKLLIDTPEDNSSAVDMGEDLFENFSLEANCLPTSNQQLNINTEKLQNGTNNNVNTNQNPINTNITFLDAITKLNLFPNENETESNCEPVVIKSNSSVNTQPKSDLNSDTNCSSICSENIDNSSASDDSRVSDDSYISELNKCALSESCSCSSSESEDEPTNLRYKRTSNKVQTDSYQKAYHNWNNHYQRQIKQISSYLHYSRQIRSNAISIYR